MTRKKSVVADKPTGKEGPRLKYRVGRDRQAAILEVASELFHTNGYSNTTMEEIGNAVGISGPGLYRHFSSKGDILVQLVQRKINDNIHVIAKARTIEDRQQRMRYASRAVVGVSLEFRYSLDDLRYGRQNNTATKDSGAHDDGLPGGPSRDLIRLWSEFIADENPSLSPEDCRTAVIMFGNLIKGAMAARDRIGDERAIDMAAPVVEALLDGSFIDDWHSADPTAPPIAN